MKMTKEQFNALLNCIRTQASHIAGGGVYGASLSEADRTVREARDILVDISTMPLMVSKTLYDETIDTLTKQHANEIAGLYRQLHVVTYQRSQMLDWARNNLGGYGERSFYAASTAQPVPTKPSEI